MKVIRILCASLAMSACVAAQTSTTPSTTTRPRTTSSSTPTAASASRVTLPSGTAIEVRVNENLSSESTSQGQQFTGTVTTDVTDPNTNRVIIPRGADVTGRVLSATPSGRLSNSGELQLSINTIRYGTAVSNITVEPYVIKGGSQTKSTATKVGGGAALGAIIGAIAGGGKGAAIGAGVGGAAGAGTAAATGKRPAEVQPEALLKFVTSGNTTVTAADQSGYRYPASSAAQTTPSASTSAPETARPASTSTTQSTSDPAVADTTGTVDSDNSDAPPVMHRRDGSTATTSAASTDNSIGTAATRDTTSNTTTASNGAYGTSNPPATGTSTTGGVYGSTTTATTTGSASPTTTAPNTTYPSSSTSTTTTSSPASTSTTIGATTPTAPSTTTSSTTSTTSSLPDNRLFSARDRRVVNQCLRDNASSLPAGYMRKGTASSGYQRGQTIPVDIQRQLRSLPLACDNQLPAVSNDLERVIYGGQVMLIDSSSRILDAFDVTP